MSRVEKRIIPVILDEAAIRAAYLAGDTPSAIANRCHDREHFEATREFIAANRDEWLKERVAIRRAPDAHKIVVDKLIYEDEMGRMRFMRISLPRISMHVAALQEAMAI